MAGVFFSSPYLKGGKQSAKLANLTKYISTREGVELLKDTASDLPVTKQQQDFISRLLKTFPDTREMPEYEDYKSRAFAEECRGVHLSGSGELRLSAGQARELR